MRPLLAVGEVIVALIAAVVLSTIAFVTVWVGYWSVLRGEFPPPIPNVTEPTTGLLIALIGTQAVCFVFVAAVLVLIRVSPRSASSPRWHPLVAVVLGGGVGVLAVGFAWGMTSAMSMLGLEVEEQPWLVKLASEDPAALWSLAPWIVLVGPFAEEVFFRGYVFRFLTERGGVLLGVLLSALMFGIVHFHPPLLPVYFVYGVMFAWLYDRTGRLVTPVVAHITVNFVGVILLWLSVSLAPSAS
ncbi:MAG: CPBP family intramembrane glutamic endopeptidase [Acidobacteriota bacterium]|nr:CPBP family intramembrane glutamic endopeptidase [Acidobacteriota bacterium]